MENQPNICLSLASAAAITGVGEAAIRRAYHDGRVEAAFALRYGLNVRAVYLTLESVVKTYGVNGKTRDEIVAKWIPDAITMHRLRDQKSWMVIDLISPIMAPEEIAGQ